MRIRDLFEKYGQEDVKIVASYILDKSYGQILAEANNEVAIGDLAAIVEVLEKIEDGIPIQYALGRWEFYSREYLVNPNVLIPRRETELLCEFVLAEGLKGKKVLDIGTGSGAIAITLALEEPSCQVCASDISKAALEVAKSNASRLEADIKLYESDLFENIYDKFDIVVSNPPYISQADYDDLDELLYFEPKNALLAGDKGYEIYQRIIDKLPDYLNDGGKVFFEIGYDQGNVLKAMLLEKGFVDIYVHKDYGNIDRIIEGCYKKGSDI